jgi:hypothetical protein
MAENNKPSEAKAAGSGNEKMGGFSNTSQGAFVNADNHFVRQVVISLIEGRSCGTGSAVDEAKVRSYIQQAEMALGLVKQAEAKRQL